MASQAGHLPTRPVPYPPYDGTQPCRDLDPELFFPVTSRESYYHPQQTRPACGGCPFLSECRDYAISYGVSGFWGGMSEVQREKERERLGIAPIRVGMSDRALRRQMLAQVDVGDMSAAEVAIRVGCAPDTVRRIRKEQRRGAA